MHEVKKKGGLREDFGNLVLLVLLYMLQGIPLGLMIGTVPFMLKKTMSYTDIGVFSFAVYPYSMKFLWAPIVDTHYLAVAGRRKS